MNTFTSLLIPLLLSAIGIYALHKRIEVFPTFLNGATQGIKTAVGLLPTLIGLLTAVYMLRASGFIDIIGQWCTPLLQIAGIPEECAALVFLKPISGGGGLALGTEIMQSAGADSYAGLTAAVMLGASETSIYTISVYSGHIGLKNTRYAITAALLGDITAFISAAFFVRQWLV